MPTVNLNGNNLHIVKRRSGEFVDSATFKQFADVLKLTGGQRQEDLQGRSSLVLPSPIYGIGRSYSPTLSFNDPTERMRVYDATADTRWPDGVYIPILEEDSTETGLEVMRAWTTFKGGLHAIWEDDNGTDLITRSYTGSTTSWGGGGALALSGAAVVGLDIIAHKTHLLVLEALSNDHGTLRSTNGTSWGNATVDVALNLLTNAVTVHEDIDAGLLASIGNEAVEVLWHEANGTITFFSSTDAGNNWTDEAVDIPSGNGPQGVAVMPGLDNEGKLYVGTQEGLYEVDTAPATWTTRLIFPMVSNSNNCRRMAVGSDGALWFAQGVDNNRAPIVYRMFISDGRRRIEQVPNDFSLGDSPPSDALGPIRWMWPSGGFMYASAGGGAASRNARIWCHNGLGWHSVRKHGTADKKIEAIIVSSDDDGMPRLHYAIRTAAGTSNTVFLANPDVSPQSGVSIKRELNGFVDRPEFNGGMPTTDGALLQYRADATNLSDDNTGEYINIDYGVNGPTRGSFTDWGDILSGTKTLPLASSLGVQAISFAIRENLIRDAADNTQSPVLRSSELVYQKKPDILEEWTFTVDIKETTRVWKLPAKDVIDNLKTAADSKIQVTFSYANSGTKNINVEGISWRTEQWQPAGTRTAAPSDTMSQIIGFADVLVREAI